jgi:hypothetical protein
VAAGPAGELCQLALGLRLDDRVGNRPADERLDHTRYRPYVMAVEHAFCLIKRHAFPEQSFQVTPCKRVELRHVGLLFLLVVEQTAGVLLQAIFSGYGAERNDAYQMLG